MAPGSSYGGGLQCGFAKSVHLVRDFVGGLAWIRTK